MASRVLVAKESTAKALSSRMPKVVPAPPSYLQDTNTPGASSVAFKFGDIPVFAVNENRQAESRTSHPPFPLQIGAVDAPLEREADRVAEHVIRKPSPSASSASGPRNVLQRKCGACKDEEHEKLARKESRAGAELDGTQAPPIVQDALRLPVQPLDVATRGRETSQATTGWPPPITSARNCAWNFGAISVERKDGVVHGPAGAANRFDDCPAQWKTAANTAQTLGSSWVANVVNALTSLPKPLPVPEPNLLTKHSHTTCAKSIQKIAGRYKQLNTAINHSIDFQCEPP